jgi:hypothetical protein
MAEMGGGRIRGGNGRGVTGRGALLSPGSGDDDTLNSRPAFCQCESDPNTEFLSKGRYYWNKWTEEGFTKGTDHFQQAVDKDPGFKGHVGATRACGSARSRLITSACRKNIVDDGTPKAHGQKKL